LSKLLSSLLGLGGPGSQGHSGGPGMASNLPRLPKKPGRSAHHATKRNIVSLDQSASGRSVLAVLTTRREPVGCCSKLVTETG
jgi:hypothetical protein